ncbi:MAG: hypothetical protein WA001_01710 [Patescibacteria group bacterium]
MAFTETQIIALEAAIASGVLTVRYDTGRTVTYQSLDEMMKLLAMMRAEVAVSVGGRSTFAAHRRD